jgi:hypothetical protein
MDIPYSVETVLKCFISALAVNQDTVLLHSEFHTVLDKCHIYTGNTEKYIQPIYTATTIKDGATPTASWYIHGLSSALFHEHISLCNEIEWKYNPTEIHEHIKNRYSRAIRAIRFTSVIIDEVNLFISSINQPFLGVLLDTSCTLDILQKIEEVREETGVQYIITANTLHDMKTCIHLKKPNHFNNTQYIIYKLLVLSYSSYFIGYSNSVLSELIFWFSGHHTKMYSV